MKRRIKTLDGVDVTSPIDGDRLRLALQVKSASINEVFYTKFLKKCQAGQDIFPLNAPSMPLFPANSAFLNYVNALGDESSKLVVESVKGSDGKKRVERRLEYSDLLHRQVQEALRNPDFNLPVEIGPHQYKVANFVLGHRWGDAQAEGPRPAKVMLIGKNPWSEEVNDRRSLDGEDGNLLRKLFHQAGIKDVTSFYVTYLCKFMPPDWKTTLKAVWIKDCLPLLHQELRIVQPRYILCLGADAHKALFNNATSLSDLEGRVESFEYNCAFSDRDGDSKRIEAKVMTVINPKQVLRDQSQQRQLEMGISRFSSLIRGVDLSSTEKIDHRVVDSHVSLLQILTEIEAAQKDNVVAVDAEWHGQHPVNAGSYMRTIQFAWAPKRAVGIKLHEPGGEPTEGFTSDDESSVNHRGILHCTINLLNTFFKGGKIEINGSEFTFKPKRVVGHFFNADLEWLLDYGIDIQAQFLVPLNDYVMDASKKATKRYKQYKEEGFKENDTVPAWYRTKFEGGADTGLMCHAIEETASYKLETLAMRYTTAPRYDKQLQTWRVEYCQSSGLDSGSLEGYGMCPDDILLPYGMYDADVTLRLFYKFAVLLDEDYDGNSCREAFWESQIATPAVLEIHRTGITVDKGRIDFLTEKFLKAKNKLEAKLRKKINWPDFNIRSVQHVKELLFGHQLNGRVDKETGKAVRIRPPDAISLNLMPLFDTSKPPKKWIDIVKQKKTKEHSPTTGKQALALMAQGDIPEKSRVLLNTLRDYRFLDQVLKTVLRPPVVDGETEEHVFDDEGNWTYEDGLAAAACDDGKVRTHIYQTKETGRWSSARPNLQNISKQRDPDYERLLGEDYPYTLRSVLKASPGHVLIEADYIGAELFGMAVMSGDTNMIDHAIRNQLAESDPNYYDIHSNVAVRAFKLDCLPTKKGLEAVGRKSLRIVAKSVIFGIAYGRGAKAIAVAAKEQGIDITDLEAQAVIDAIFSMYPRLLPFFQECRDRALGRFVDAETNEPVSKRYLCNCYGRFRRFPHPGHDNGLAAEFERQAMNFPIQSMIASAVSRALAHTYAYKAKRLREGTELFKILLQIHDAILLEVPFQFVRHVCEYVLPTYMRRSVPIYPTNLDGMPTGSKPYYLGLDVHVMEHWGEDVTYERAEKLGLPTGSLSVDGCSIHYSDSPARGDKR